MNQTERQEFENLFSQLCEGAISDSDFADLEQRLQGDVQVRRFYLEYIDLDATLQLGSFGTIRQLSLEDECTVESRSLDSTRASLTSRRRIRPRTLQFGSVALIVLATIVGWMFLNGSEEPVAIVKNSPNAKWAKPIRAKTERLELFPGKIELAAGMAQIEFFDGTNVFMSGPSVLDLQSRNECSLEHGHISVRVDEGPFVVSTDQAEFIDRGTEFSVSVTRTGTVEAHVFEGEIDAMERGNEEPSNSSKSITLRRGQAIRFEPKARAEVFAANSSNFVKTRQVMFGILQTTGQLKFLETMPRSLEEDQFERDDCVIFSERKGVLVRKAIAVAFTEPGKYSEWSRDSERLSGGQSVDSFLIHFDPKDDTDGVRVAGSVTFATSVVAVIASSGLLPSDLVFGLAGTRYDQHELRRLGAFPQVDVVTLSEDRHTLTIDWTTGSHTDDIRVLTASQ